MHSINPVALTSVPQIEKIRKALGFHPLVFLHYIIVKKVFEKRSVFFEKSVSTRTISRLSVML